MGDPIGCGYGSNMEIVVSILHIVFGFIVQKLPSFKDFCQSLGMQSTTANAANSAKICQNLSKEGTLKYHQKLRF
jgi:hypothetical protein